MTMRTLGALVAGGLFLSVPTPSAAQLSCGYCYQCENNPYAAGTYCGCILCHNNKDCIPGCIWGWCSDLVPCDSFGGGFAATARLQLLGWELARADGSRMAELLARYPEILRLDLQRRVVEIRGDCEGTVALIPIPRAVDPLLAMATWAAHQGPTEQPLAQLVRSLLRTDPPRPDID